MSHYYRKSNLLRPIFYKLVKIPIRKLNLVEYQSKNLLQKHGLTVQKFCLINHRLRFQEFQNFNAKEYVIKAQILAGGRGKGHFDTGFKGGVKITNDKEKAKEYVSSMLGHRLITKQTPKKGVLVNEVMVAESVTIIKETYVCLAMDRQCNGPVLLISPHGGVDVETVASKSPSLLRKIPIDIYEGITDVMANEVSDFLKFPRELKPKVIKELKMLWELFNKVDALQIEINPLAAVKPNDIVCIDAKLNFDDNASFRQKEIFSMPDYGETDPHELEAAKHDFTYVKLDGDIGCLVNGAGLAMATMDIIKLFGGSPANFLDVGGTITETTIKKAFQLLISDPKVKVILVNVFGGIVNCELIANGIISVAKCLRVPLVVRLQGTQAESGRKLLAEAAVEMDITDDFEEAAKKAVSYVEEECDEE
ncbi:succinyl-coa synthetase beta chain [Holotrichia oblita]|uniref:Succinyl-coa synthetase beta chain n=4 Tax=Holotrichia oblita TaxID=644536 RepID=A0ACB9SND6_HOLOL|nr:succinyl-coa synthetase beta chain [Holotrichia oblita]KAI4456852.1 succinyl-coa synthetase beta chain [Holotrichia oblita]KAI4456853.1 succinyl-coa synthetase beta chain [Holotrichia oblita]KAI4461862.1 succinyl-coa synthetase beta chain [Holotrichia oblita]